MSLSPSVPLFVAQKELSQQCLECMPVVQLDRTFSGLKSTHSFSATVVLTPTALILKAYMPLVLLKGEKPNINQFVEGLWEKNVVEFFFSLPERRDYLEFHLSPKGEWWFCEFSDVRERAKTQKKVQAKLHHKCEGSRVMVILESPRKILSPFFDEPAKVRANITACSNEATKEFVSYLELPGKTPNFHQPEKFPRVLVVPTS